MAGNAGDAESVPCVIFLVGVAVVVEALGAIRTIEIMALAGTETECD
jgi:hypothetical protein